MSPVLVWSHFLGKTYAAPLAPGIVDILSMPWAYVASFDSAAVFRAKLVSISMHDNALLRNGHFALQYMGSIGPRPFKSSLCIHRVVSIHGPGTKVVD